MVTKRDWLVEHGLAKPGKGKFSAVAIEALKQAEAKGIKFDEPAYTKPAGTVKRTEIRLPESLKAKMEKANASAGKTVAKAYDPKAVRDWATKNGIEVSARGRLSADLVNGYLESLGDNADVHIPEVKEPKAKKEAAPKPEKAKKTAAVKEAPKVTPKDIPQQKPVRPEKVAWGLTQKRHNWETPCAVQFSTCQADGCKKPIEFCPGHGPEKMPLLPKYMGGGPMSFERPKV